MICGFFSFFFLTFYSRFLEISIGLSEMDFLSSLKFLTETEGFGCGFVVFGRFSQVLNLFLFVFLFVLGFKLVQFKVISSPSYYLPSYYSSSSSPSSPSYRQKLNGFKSKTGFVSEDRFSSGVHHEKTNFPTGFRSDDDFAEGFHVKSKDFSNGFSLNDDDCDGFDQKQHISCVFDDNLDANDEMGSLDEDHIFDVIALRNMVKKERKIANDLYTEVEKERMAAASAAEESMAMLLRLRMEKSVTEMEATQYKRIAEQKQEYDLETIQGLQWLVMKHEEDREVLVKRLKLCMKKLKMFVGSEDDDEEEDDNDMVGDLFFSSAVEGDMGNETVVESGGI